ncbi:MAG: large conductance mechanosensitive channel protein MscL [Candidatus Paceibacterota bacterium]
MIEEFKKFAIKGNAVDLAVGVVIGAAFGKIVSSVVNDLINPILSIFTGKIDFSNLSIPLTETSAIMYGNFINALIEFIIIAFSIFLVVKAINKLNEKDEEPAAPTTKTCRFCKEKINIEATKCAHCTGDQN